MSRSRGNISERLAKAKFVLAFKKRKSEESEAKFLEGKFYSAIRISCFTILIITFIVWLDLLSPGKIIQDEIKGHERFKQSTTRFSSGRRSGGASRSFYLHIFLMGKNGNIRSLELRDNENFELPKDFSPIEIEFSKILRLPKNVTIESSGLKARVTNSIFSKMNLLIYSFFAILSAFLLWVAKKNWKIQRLALIVFCLNTFAIIKLFFYISG
jgi:hypothetical protein